MADGFESPGFLPYRYYPGATWQLRFHRGTGYESTDEWRTDDRADNG